VRRLIIMRHAKAGRSSTSGGDFDRPLTAQGRTDAALVGRALLAAGLTPDLALVSTSLRTRETWEEIAKSFPDTRLALNSTLYNGEEPQLRRAVADEDDVCDVLLLIAHNPGVHALAARLLNEANSSASVLDKVEQSFPPATAVAFEIDDGGRAHYDGLFFVKDLGGAGD
jgi:phosphohistidine phosphatase